MSEVYHFEKEDPPKTSSKLRITSSLGARIVTLACLTVALVVLRTNKVSIDGFQPYTYKQVYTYKYALFAMVVSFMYSILQVPSAIYLAKTGKYLINHYYMFDFDFYGDKVNSLILGTAAGALFGATMDLKNAADKDHQDDQNIMGKIRDFYQMAYIAAGFALIAFICSAFSSIGSSLALSRRS